VIARISKQSANSNVAAKLHSQLVGAFGERAVEAELLRHGWLSANFNSSVDNAREYDIVCTKDGKVALLQVKTCNATEDAFTFGGFKRDEPIRPRKFSDNEFTVLVKMGVQRASDQFYVVPTQIVHDEIRFRQTEWLGVAKRDGDRRQDIGMWVLRLSKRRDGMGEKGRDMATKLKTYEGAWAQLDDIGKRP
jgi:hypothetical protein